MKKKRFYKTRENRIVEKNKAMNKEWLLKNMLEKTKMHFKIDYGKNNNSETG